MKYLICYDIQETKLRNKVATLLESHAMRVQYNVFIGEFSDKEAAALRQELLDLTEVAEKRMLLIVPLCEHCVGRIWQAGKLLEDKKSCIIA